MSSESASTIPQRVSLSEDIAVLKNTGGCHHKDDRVQRRARPVIHVGKFVQQSDDGSLFKEWNGREDTAAQEVLQKLVHRIPDAQRRRRREEGALGTAIDLIGHERFDGLA